VKDKKKDRRRGNHFVDHYNCSLSYGRKKRSRIRYLNWVTEFYECPEGKLEEKVFPHPLHSQESLKIEELINRRVRKAVEKLPSEEKRFIQLFYFEFRSYRQIARILRRKVYKLERIHQRALGKLRILLADFVKKQFKIRVPEETDCMICRSPYRRELEKLIGNKKEEETYAKLIKVFKQKYGIDVKTPQVIIGHRRKHMV
jgi:RNA polymerase sigma factor (sigma-70 family)